MWNHCDFSGCSEQMLLDSISFRGNSFMDANRAKPFGVLSLSVLVR